MRMKFLIILFIMLNLFGASPAFAVCLFDFFSDEPTKPVKGHKKHKEDTSFPAFVSCVAEGIKLLGKSDDDELQDDIDQPAQKIGKKSKIKKSKKNRIKIKKKAQDKQKQQDQQDQQNQPNQPDQKQSKDPAAIAAPAATAPSQTAPSPDTATATPSQVEAPSSNAGSLFEVSYLMGYTLDSQFSGGNQNIQHAGTVLPIFPLPALQGAGFAFRILVPIQYNDFWQPLLGGGFNYSSLRGQETGLMSVTPGSSPDSATTTVEYNSLTAEADAGAKFKFNPFSLVTLFNFGYGPHDELNIYTVDNSQSGNNYNYTASVKQNYFYGLSVEGLYEIIPRLNLGIDITDRMHFLDINFSTPDSFTGSSATQQDIKTTFNEFSAKLVLNFDF